MIGTLRRYVDGWMRPGDDGVIALGPDGAEGAVWWRLFSAVEPGYGFVAEDVPELSLALRPEARGRGTGRALLRAALETVALEHRRISLSVDRANPALRLYTSVGFSKVGEDGTSDILVADLPRPT